jgi:50S ribosomal subunit-associated GTPase HflX
VPTIDVFNKCDLLEAGELDRLKALHPSGLFISAKSGAGRVDLVDILASRLEMDVERMHLAFDARRDGDRKLVADLYRHAQVVSHITTGDRMVLEADVPRRLMERFLRAQVPA